MCVCVCVDLVCVFVCLSSVYVSACVCVLCVWCVRACDVCMVGGMVIALYYMGLLAVTS